MSNLFKHNKTKKGGNAIKPRSGASDLLRGAVTRMNQKSGIGSISEISALGTTPPPATNTSTKNAPAKKGARRCPNPDCTDPSAPVQEGFCSACGREIDTSNIVSEVTFGETSSGAAMVQGTRIGADQGASRTMGPGMRRMGGSIENTREKTVREAKQVMQQYAQQLRISETIVNEAVQIFKLCLHTNWIQGRGMNKVIPVCLYAACRRQDHCRVMQMDFADLTKINVFELGHVFKQLDDIYDFSHNQIKGVVPEDLIYRFCDKLDFGELTGDVANLAIRFCQRMGLDWMVAGRRPSGICGACILMAARQFGFRRTAREIVYIVKVTMHTIEQRLEEFKVVESADMTIEDFLKNELLETRHDPPAFYRQTAEWQEKMEKERGTGGRKRKRIEDYDSEDEADNQREPTPGESSTLRVTTVASAVSADSRAMPPPPLPPPDTSKLRQVTDYLKRSKDPETGAIMVEAFDRRSIPPPPPRVTQDLTEGFDADDPTGDEAVDHLAEAYAGGDEEIVEAEGDEEGEAEEGEEEEASQDKPSGRGKRGRRGEPQEPLLRFSEEWEQDESNLERQINEVINDPSSDEHAKALATAAHHAHVKAHWARSLLPPGRATSMDEVIDASEFADDPEVENCLLGPDEIAVKEMIWLNTNKDWLRKQQEKQFRQEMEKLGPAKKRRNRQKKPRIGEGQLTPASTPGEAAVNAMKKVAISKRINYDAINGLFKTAKGPGSTAASSRPASEMGDAASDGREDTPVAPAAARPDKGKDKGKKDGAGEPQKDAEEEEEEAEPEPEEEEEEEEYYEEENTYEDGGYDEYGEDDGFAGDVIDDGY